MSLQPSNARLLHDLEPFVVATPDNAARFDVEPFDLAIPEAHRFNPLHTRSEVFLDLLERLDAATFGPEGMPMPRWVFFDGSELPGGIVGLGAPADRISEEARDVLKVPAGYDGLVPYSMFIAIPTYEPGVWMGHNLASLAPILSGEGLKGLASVTKALGLKVFRARGQVGVTQWNSMALFVHTRLGPLELLTAWTPAHSEAWSLTYRATITDDTLRHLAKDPAGKVEALEPTVWLDSEDHAAMQRLQAEIEDGARFAIAGRPRVRGPERLEVPVAKRAAE